MTGELDGDGDVQCPQVRGHVFDQCFCLHICYRGTGSGRNKDWAQGCMEFTDTMHLASLNVETACDVAKLEVIAEILEETGGHGWTSAALEEMTVLEGIESCETKVGHSMCFRQRSLCRYAPSPHASFSAH